MAAANTHLKKLEVFQNKVLRIITRAPWFVKNTHIRKDLGIKTVREVILYRSIEFLRDNPRGVGERKSAGREYIFLTIYQILLRLLGLPNILLC